MGGAESLVVPFIRGYDASRYELFVVCLASIGGNVVEEEVRREQVPFTNLGAKNLRDVAAFRRLLRFVREHEIELIHAHLTYAATWAALVSRITGVPSIASLHVAPPSAGTGAIARDWLMRVALDRWSSIVIAVSGALRDQYLRLRSVDPAKYRAVHNGIELARFEGDRATSRELLTRELGIPPGARVAVTVSVLREGKGVEMLLAAADAVVQQVPDAYLLIVGDGAKREEWMALSRTLGAAADRVRWTGYRRDVHAILPGCDLLVHPSLDDAFPTVLLEAMAAGLPVVASNVGGIPEIVAEGVTGRLVPPADPKRLTEEIVRLLADRETTTRMSDAARAIARERFSTAAWIARLNEMYAAVIPSVSEGSGRKGLAARTTHPDPSRNARDDTA
jgi:glycosyltransferase involved in cell wall biosynthesis